MINQFITRTSALAGLLMLSSVAFAQLPNPTYGSPGGIASNVTAVGNTFDVYSSVLPVSSGNGAS